MFLHFGPFYLKKITDLNHFKFWWDWVTGI